MADHGASSRVLRAFRLGAMLVAFGLIGAVATVRAQSNRDWHAAAQIESGTTVQVRTTEPVTSTTADGRVFQATVENDVLDNQGQLAIPRGSIAELMVRPVDNGEFALDLDSITVNGRRYAITADSSTVGTSGTSSLGINKETGKYVGGGALLGTIIGAVAGGGKGAAIGAGVGAAAGAGVQIATHGHQVTVPAETLLTYQLQRPLNVNVRDNGYSRDGYHYHPCC